MVVVKCSDALEGPRVKLEGTLCDVLYKDDDVSIVIWSGMDPDSKINCFTCSGKDNDLVVSGDQYNNKSKKWRGTIHNGQLHSQALRKMIITERICFKFLVYIKFNGIPRDGIMEIPIKPYKYQFHEHMVKNGMFEVFSLLGPHNQDKTWDLFINQLIFTQDYVKIYIKGPQEVF